MSWMVQSGRDRGRHFTERSERAFCPVSMRTAPPSQRLDSISLRAKVERLRASWAGRRVYGGRTVLGSLSFARRDTARSYSEPRCASLDGQQRVCTEV